MAKNKTAQKIWTTAEDEFLTMNHKKMSATEKANYLKRSKSSIYSRIYTLGLNDTKKEQEPKSETKLITKYIAKLKRDYNEKLQEGEIIKDKITKAEEVLNDVQKANLA